MNCKKSKSLRRQIYGNKNYRFRVYHKGKNNQILSDDLRQLYQKAKDVK